MSAQLTLLSDSQVRDALAELPEWEIADAVLTRQYTFGSYLEGLDFAMKVGQFANKLDHHPDLLIGYQKVKVSTTTHDAGGLTKLDFELAKGIQSPS